MDIRIAMHPAAIAILIRPGILGQQIAMEEAGEEMGTAIPTEATGAETVENSKQNIP
jgi:hypothetical protein